MFLFVNSSAVSQCPSSSRLLFSNTIIKQINATLSLHMKLQYFDTKGGLISSRKIKILSKLV